MKFLQSGLVDKFVSERLREIRLTRGISQESVANSCGVSAQQFQKYEHGDNRVTIGRLWAMARCLGVPIEDLFPTPDWEIDDVPGVPGMRNYKINSELYALMPALTWQQRRSLIQMAKAMSEGNAERAAVAMVQLEADP